MKKIFAFVLSAALLLIGTQANAQLSVGAGYLNTTESSGEHSQNLNGAYAGVNYNIPLVAGLSVAPGFYASFLTFTNKAGVSTKASASLSGTSTLNEIALNIPVNFKYGFDIARDTKVFLYAGPVFQYGVLNETISQGSAHISIGDTEIGGDTKKYKVNNYDADNGSRNPFNIYIGGGAGIDVAGIQVIIGYDHSLMNVIKSEDTKVGRSQIKVGVGYRF